MNAAADNSTVQISIKVVDANSGEVVSRTTKNLTSMGAAGAGAGKQLKGGLEAAGEAGTSSGKKIGDGMKAAGGHSLNALDNVRLVRDDLGIRIPRAMEKVISQSKLAMGAIGAIGGGLVALGAAEVLFHIGEEAYHLYEKLTDVNAEMRKFAADLGKNANQELFSNSSLETTSALIAQLTGQIGELDKLRVRAGVGQDNSGSLMQYLNKGMTLQASQHAANPAQQQELEELSAGGVTYGSKQGAKSAELHVNRELAQKQLDLLQIQQKVQEKQDAVSHAGEGVEGRAATEAKRRAQRELNDTQHSATQAKERLLREQTYRARFFEDQQNKLPVDERTQIYEVSKNAGDAELARANRNADLEAGGSNSKQTRTERNEASHAVAEANMAGQDSEKLYLDQKNEAIRQLKERRAQLGLNEDSYNKLAQAIDTKFQNELRKRIQDENQQTAQIAAEAGTRGLTGFAKVDADLSEKIAQLNRERSKFSDPGTYEKRKAAIVSGSNTEQEQAATNFNERLQQMDAARADRFESESGRIQSAADRSAAEVMKAWREAYGQLGAMDARRVQSYALVQQEIVKIQQDAEKQKAEAGRRVEDETQKLEREARRVGQPKEREETQAILDAYAERYQHLEELRAQDAANADKYRRQEIAEEQIKNGKLVDLQRQMRDKLAGELQGLFSNPLEALKKQGEEFASKAAASYILKIAKPAPGTLGTGGKQGGGLFGLPESWQDVGGFNHRGPGMRPGAGSPGLPAGPLTTVPIGPGPGASTVNATTATIHVQSATITGVGAGGGFRNASYTPGQSTRSAYGGGGGDFSTGTTGGADLGLGGPLSESPSSTPGASSAGLASSTSTSGAGGGLPDNVSSVIGNVQQLPGMIKGVDQLGKELGAGSLSKGLGKIPGASSLGKLGGQLSDPNSKLGGAAGGALGLFSAFEGGGGIGGGFQGALSGAQLGGTLAGPAGALVGAAAGAIIGFIGFGARHKAAIYDRHTVKPQLAADLRSFEAGSSDYQTVYNDMDKLRLDAKLQTRQMGSGAKGYFDDTIKPEIDAAQARLTRENKAGRSDFGMTAAQFHGGGLISGFGDLGTSSTEGFIHALMGERVINPVASSAHAQGLDAINSGASHGDMAAYYGGAATAPVAAQAADVNLHFHSPDAKGARDLLMSNKHHVRAALNSSYEENSGGYDFA